MYILYLFCSRGPSSFFEYGTCATPDDVTVGPVRGSGVCGVRKGLGFSWIRCVDPITEAHSEFFFFLGGGHLASQAVPSEQ